MTAEAGPPPDGDDLTERSDRADPSSAAPPRDSDTAIDRVFAALSGGEPDVAADALSALSHLDAEGRARVTAGLRALDAAARFVFLEQLAEAAEASALLDYWPIWLDALSDADPFVRALAAANLATAEDRVAIRPLAHAAREDPDAPVRTEAALALGRYALQAALGRLGARDREVVVGTLRALAGDVQEDPSVQASALAAVGVIAEPWVTDLIYDALESGDPVLRRGAIEAMGRTADPEWLPTLADLLHAADEDERAAAATAAGEIGEEDAVPDLAEALEDESLDVVLAAVDALGAIGGAEAMECLGALRTHPEPALRVASHDALEVAAFADDPLGIQG